MRKSLLSVLVLCTAFFILLGALPESAHTQKWTYQPYKDEALAGFLSFTTPGLGLFYAGKPKLGFLFLFSEIGLLAGSILNVADLHFGLRQGFGFEAYLKLKGDISTARIVGSVGMGVGFMALRVVDVILAIKTARAYNQHLFESRMLHAVRLVPVFSTPGSMGMACAIRF